MTSDPNKIMERIREIVDEMRGTDGWGDSLTHELADNWDELDTYLMSGGAFPEEWWASFNRRRPRLFGGMGLTEHNPHK